MIKAFLMAIFYRLLQWTVQFTVVVYTVHYNRTYSPLAESVVDKRKKSLSLMEEMP